MEASIQGQIAVSPHTNSLAFFFSFFFCGAGMSAKVGRDGWLCLEGKREGVERCRRTGVLPYGTHLIAFSLCYPFSFPPSSAHFTSVYQVPSVSGLR